MPHTLTACVLLTLAVVPGLEVGTGPEPSPQPISWELGFRFLDPQRIEVQLPGRSKIGRASCRERVYVLV
jgi:hypothetical protein